METSVEVIINPMSHKQEPLSVESAVLRTEQKYHYTSASAHPVDNDSWQQVGLLMSTSFNCGYILSYSNLIMVPLGWTWGSIGLVTIGAFSFYANWILAGFHVIDGQRFIRYRDLMGFVLGRRMYYVTWILQFFTLSLGNMGFILLGGRALKEVNSEFSNSPLRLQIHIIITGAVYCIFAFCVPTISAMRNWLMTSAILTVTYVVALLAILIKDGKSRKTNDYSMDGNEVDRVFYAFGAIAAIIVSGNSGLLPEIQSTIRKPITNNMRKALASQFSVGLAIYYGVTIVGYWAYGSSASEYLPRELTGPKWGKILINIAAFTQGSLPMFIAPVHEALDTKFLKLDQSISSKENLTRRFFLRAALFGLFILVTAAFPFMADFINLLGSFTILPLTFLFPSLIFIKVKGENSQRWLLACHWANVIICSILTIATTASAIRIIINNSRIYSFFPNT